MSIIASRHASTSSGPLPMSRNSTVSRPSSSSSLLKRKFSRQLQQPHITFIEHKLARFLITDQPTRVNMENFLLACRMHHVTLLVRVSERTYDEQPLLDAGIQVVDLEFEDGASPPEHIVRQWFQVVMDLWQREPDSCVAVHCRAGLGRAPTLVATALIALGVSYDEAIEMIRNLRSGALNARQIQYLKNFRPPHRLRIRLHPDRCCLL